MITASVRADATRRALDTLAGALHQAAALTVRAAVKAAEASAKGTGQFHDRSGDTRASIRGEAFALSGFVSASGAARFLEFGTEPHLIVASGRALRFVVAGQVLYRAWVRHPGTREHPFMREARERGEQAALYGAELYVSAAVRNVR